MNAKSRKPRVYLTRPIPGQLVAGLDRIADVTMNREDRPAARDELLAGVAGKEGVLSLVTDRIDREVFDRAPELRVVANMAVGYDNIDVEEARRRGIVVTHTPGVLTESTADLAFALILAVARRVIEGDRWVRSGDWPGWGPQQLLGRDVHGAVLGIVGMGRIGRALVPRAQGFGMRVLAWNRSPLGSEAEQLGVEEVETLHDLLEASDFVSLHVAASPGTHHLIGAPELEKLGANSYLINTARGSVVYEKALVQALESRVIAGAGLDVFEREPAVEEGLRRSERTVLLPHLGSASVATRSRMADMALSDLLAVCRGEAPQFPVP